jgi:protein-tyrosine phosphatase
MHYALFFVFIATGLAAYALGLGLGWTMPTPIYELLLSASIGFYLAGMAYLFHWPALLGKRPDGTRHWWAWPLMWSYFLFCWAGWSGWAKFKPCKKVSAQHAMTQILPGLWLSRSLSDPEARITGLLDNAKCVIDLAAEFVEPPALRAQPGYLSLPVLEGTRPSIRQLRKTVEHMDKYKSSGILVHGAVGQNRAALVVAAYLLYAGHAATPKDAFQIVKKARKSTKLKKNQLAGLTKFHQSLKKPD